MLGRTEKQHLAVPSWAVPVGPGGTESRGQAVRRGWGAVVRIFGSHPTACSHSLCRISQNGPESTGKLNETVVFRAAPGLWFSCWNYIIVQNLDWPVSRETPSLFLSRTRMASFPYCEYHALRLLLRYVPGGADSSFSCCRCQMNREVSLYRCRAWPSDSAFSARGTRPLIPGPASPPGPAREAPSASPVWALSALITIFSSWVWGSLIELNNRNEFRPFVGNTLRRAALQGDLRSL